MNIIALMALLFISGCSGITPDGNIHNNREEGPKQGLFSGPTGEFVIVAPASETDVEKTKEKDAKNPQW